MTPLGFKIVLGCAVILCVVAGMVWVMGPKDNGGVPYADVAQLQQLLSAETEQLQEKIAVEPLELSLPTDGKGPRLLARVPKGMASGVPEVITVTLKSKQLVVPITVEDNFEVYKAQ